MACMRITGKDKVNELLFVGFNQDGGCFACGTDTGFRIFNVEPFKETFERKLDAGVGCVEMLFRCNLLAIVGGGKKNPWRIPTKVMVWDDYQHRSIGELSFRAPVRAVRLRRDRVVVVLEHKVYVYNFKDLQVVDHIDTISNQKGLCSVCPNSNNTILACPGVEKGYARVERYDLDKTILIPAHTGNLQYFTLNHDGTRLATASDKGTLIRVFDTESGEQLQELRRGSGPAEIYCIAFDRTTQYLACSSDKGTVHVFVLNDKVSGRSSRGESKSSGGKKKKTAKNTTSSFSMLKGIFSVLGSEWSFAQFKVPCGGRTIVSFSTQQKNCVVIVSSEGIFYTATFDPKSKSKEMTQTIRAKFYRKSLKEERKS